MDRITLHQNGANQPATRIEEAAAPVDLADYAGRYYSEELETFYTLALQDGRLVAQHRRFDDDVPLTHTRGDEFSGGFPLATVAFEREGDQLTGFRAGNGRARDIWFERVEE